MYPGRQYSGPCCSRSARIGLSKRRSFFVAEEELFVPSQSAANETKNTSPHPSREKRVGSRGQRWRRIQRITHRAVAKGWVRRPLKSDFTLTVSLRQDDLMIATMRSIPKGGATSTPAQVLAASPTTGFLSADPLWANSGPGRTPQQASAAWTQREIESRHHFIIASSLRLFQAAPS